MGYYTEFYLLSFTSYHGNTDRVVNIFNFGIVKLTFRKCVQVISTMCVGAHSGLFLGILCIFCDQMVVPFWTVQ